MMKVVGGEPDVSRSRGLTIGQLADRVPPARLIPGQRHLSLPPVRQRFGGPLGYASLPFEGVDWTRSM